MLFEMFKKGFVCLHKTYELVSVGGVQDTDQVNDGITSDINNKRIETRLYHGTSISTLQ